MGDPLARVSLGLVAGLEADSVGVALVADSVGLALVADGVGVAVCVTVAVEEAVAVVVAVAVFVAVAVVVAVAVSVVVTVAVGDGVEVVGVGVGAAWDGRDAVGSATDGDWAAALEIAADTEERMSDALLEIALPTLPPHAVKVRSPTAATNVSLRELVLVICHSLMVTALDLWCRDARLRS